MDQTTDPTAAAAGPINTILDTAGEWGVTLLVVAAIIFGIITLVKVWPILTKVVTIGNAIMLLPDMQRDLKRTSEEVQAVKHEVLPNNGGSFRDDFSRLSARVDEHILEESKRLKSVEGSLRSLHKKTINTK